MRLYQGKRISAIWMMIAFSVAGRDRNHGLGREEDALLCVQGATYAMASDSRLDARTDIHDLLEHVVFEDALSVGKSHATGLTTLFLRKTGTTLYVNSSLAKWRNRSKNAKYIAAYTVIPSEHGSLMVSCDFAFAYHCAAPDELRDHFDPADKYWPAPESPR